MTSGLERSMELLSTLTPASQAGVALGVVTVQFAIVVAALAWRGRLRLAELLLTEYEDRLALTLQRHQQQLTHLTRLAIVGELSGALAHQVLQPLTAILCNTQAAQFLLAEGQCNAAVMGEILRDISSDNQHAGQVIHRLRALFRRGEIQFRPIEVRDLLHDVLAIVGGTLIERNVRLETDIADPLPAVYADRIELQQVLLNLILNACESMVGNARDRRRIAIVVALDGGQNAVRISVMDWGSRIDAQLLERVFDPLFTTKTSPLGFGLSICHSIIAAHKGRLWAANESDRGAAFHFTVPLAMTEGGQ
jgi:C4-dicarboxylate-specific signal transduction histidine kinase